MPLVVLEGPDGSGKSEAGRQLRARWEAMRPDGRVIEYHNGPPPEREPQESPQDYRRRIAIADGLLSQIRGYDIEEIDVLLIIDRAHLSNVIYGNIFREETSHDGWGELGEQSFAACEQAYAERGGVLAVLAPPAGLLHRRARFREDAYLDAVDERDILAEPPSEVLAKAESRAVRRMRRLSQISAMYDYWLDQHCPDFVTYQKIGHPFYRGRDDVDAYGTPHAGMLTTWNKTSNEWPAAAFESDPRIVACRILGHAIDVQVALHRKRYEQLVISGSSR